MSALFSLWPRYLSRVLTGKKSVELRLRAPRLSAGDVLWFYCTLPRGALEATAVAERVVTDSPGEIWRQWEHRLGLSVKEFQSYAGGRKRVSAIVFDKACGFRNPLPLHEIRSREPNFHPPQFYTRILAGSQLAVLFSDHCKSNTRLKRTRAPLSQRVMP